MSLHVGRAVSGIGSRAAGAGRDPRVPRLIHAAEGELFRDAFRQAARSCDLVLTEVMECELETRAAEAVGLPARTMKSRIAGWGRELGPPWREDQKLAATVARLALTKRSAQR